VSAGLALAVVAAALWGLAPVATKGALAGYSPELISVVRLALASMLFRVVAGRGARWLPRERWACVAGVALGADFILYNYGLRRTSAALAGLVINVEVVSTIAFALWLLDERLTLRRALGAAITLAGVVYVAADGVRVADLVARERVVGNVLVMLAGVAWSLFAIAQRRAPRDGNLFRLLTPIFVVAMLTTLPSLLVASAWRNPGGTVPTAMLGALIVFCTVAVYLVYARSQELVDVSLLAIALTSIPIFALGFARLLLGEAITSRVVAGAIVIVAGVLLIATERALPTTPAGAPD
jgi:drug/metabolite transporter (DMT)-like permease